MDELDKLKNHWQKNEAAFPQVSEKEIYGMLHKKSSSIVKWILIISILEFAFQLSLSFLLKDTPGSKQIEAIDIDYIMIPLTLLSYAIMIYFFRLFYINYKKITATDSVRNLMSSILNTRKTVSNYIYVNLSYILVSFIIILVTYINKDEHFAAMFHKSEVHGNAVKLYLLSALLILITLVIIIGTVWLFYKLLYGLLLKKLHRNYEELKKIDF